MYQYIFDDETTNKVNQKTKSAKSIFDQFNDVDDRYSNLWTVGGEPNLEKINYQKPSSEEVKQNATSALEGYKNSSINNINQSFEEKNKKLNDNITSAKEASNSELETIKQNYSAVKQDAKDDAIKRGLARSSIIVNTLSSLDNGMLNALNEKTNELSKTLKGFENERAVLENQKQTALNNFDIEYAVKLQDKINEMNSEIDKKEKEVLEYNNKIEETKAKWEQDKNNEAYNRTVELAKLLGEQGISMFDTLKQNEKYELAKSHFAGMTKEDAILELQNNQDYKKHLGSAFYNKLLNELQG